MKKMFFGTLFSTTLLIVIAFSLKTEKAEAEYLAIDPPYVMLDFDCECLENTCLYMIR